MANAWYCFTYRCYGPFCFAGHPFVCLAADWAVIVSLTAVAQLGVALPAVVLLAV
jgi:hypothetical protein